MESLSRAITTHNTETILLLVCLLLIAGAKALNAGKFQYFLSVFFSERYLKIYGKAQSLHYNWFHIFLLGVQLISFGLFFKIAIAYFKLDIAFSLFIIILFITVFILSKFIIEKTIAFLFNIEKFVDRYNFYKLSYRNFMGIVLLPFNALLIYNPMQTNILLYVTIAFFLLLNTIAIVLTLKNNQKTILPRPFYFILYICTLEIAPYLIVARSLIVT